MNRKEPVEQCIRIGILALFAHGELFYSKGKSRITGGAEKRSILLGEMLKELGYSVSIVLATPPWYCKKPKMAKGFKLYYHKRYQRSGRVVVRKLFTASLAQRVIDKIRLEFGRSPRKIEAINRQLFFGDFDRVEADVWFALSVNDITANLSDYCYLNDRPLVLGLACDLDIDFISTPNGTDAYGASRLAKSQTLSRACSILVQNKFQQQIIRQIFPSKPVFFIRNPIKVAKCQPQESSRTYDVVWVGRFHFNKNPDGLLRIAKLIPEISFLMICNKGQSAIELQIKKKLPSNVKLIEFVPPNEMSQWYQNAYLHVSTSFQEGFPNSFLEAAMHELPTFSLHVDPDGLMTKNVLGSCFYGDEKAMILAIKGFLNNPEIGFTQGKIAREYAVKYHAYPKIKEELALAMNVITTQIDTDKKE